MTRLLKGIGLLVLLCVVAIAAAFYRIDPNDYKTQIAQLAEAQTGRRLIIQENFSLSFFPWVGIRLGAMELGNAPGFGDKPFASIQSAHVQVKLLPLFQKKVEVDTLHIQGLQLNLEKNAAGISNWSDLQQSSTNPPEERVTHTATPSIDATQPILAKTALLASVAVEGIQLTETRISWRDAQTNRTKILTDLSLTTGPLLEQVPIPLTLKFRAAEEGPSPRHFDMTFAGNLVANLAERVFHLHADHTTVTAQGEKLPSGKIALDSTFSLELHWQQETVHLKKWHMSGGGLQVDGQVDGQKILSNPQFLGTLTVQPFSPRELFQQWGLADPITQDPSVLHTAGMAITFSADPNQLILKDVQAHWDESQLHGNMAFNDFKKMAIRWDLSVDTLDIDRYLPPSSQENSQPHTPQAQASIKTTTQQPSSANNNSSQPVLHGLDLDGRIRLEKLKASRLAFQAVDAKIQAQQGVFRLTSLQAQLYHGVLSADASIDMSNRSKEREALPLILLNSRLQDVQSGPLLHDLNGRDTVMGTAGLSCKLTTTGNDRDSAKNNLQGTAQFSLKDGAIKGVDIAQLLRDAYNVTQGIAPERQQGPQATDFSSLKGSVTIDNGIIKNKDLVIISQLFNIQGHGDINLPQEQVDYHVDTSVSQALQNKGGRTLNELTGLTIPIRVTGPLSTPSWKIDLKTLLEKNATKKAREKIQNKVEEKVQEQIKKHGLEKLLPEDLGKRLMDAFPFR